jgi:hypothetical protein
VILDRTIVAASLVAEGASNPTLAEAGWPCDEQVLVAVFMINPRRKYHVKFT